MKSRTRCCRLLPLKSVFHDASCLGALVDRFAQHCHVLDIDAESWRNKEALKRGKSRKPKSDDD